MQFETIEIQIVTPHEERPKKRLKRQIFLIHEHGNPLMLGSGRYADVALASGGVNLTETTEFFAVKFLRRDPGSNVFSAKARDRFFEELQKSSLYGTRARPGTFIPFRGFSRICDPPTDLGPQEFYERKIVEEFQAEIDETSLANKAKAYPHLSDEFKSRIQGEFFVMDAAFGTLDDLLVFQHTWESSKVYSIPDSTLTRGLATIATLRGALVKELLHEFGLSAADGAAHSGFSILRAIGKHNKPLYYAITLSLLRKIAESLASVHSFKFNEEGFLAHRDLKPGNFLIAGNPDQPSICLTDLGFVSGVESIKQGIDTGPASAKEPNVLAPGSYMFRAPEQIESGYEIFFSKVDDDHKKIRIHCQREVKVDKGDWIDCDDFKFPGSGLTKTEVVEVEPPGSGNANTITVTLGDPFVPSAPTKLYYHGYVIKLSGQHSDIFSLGCIFYYIVSGGKNPEKFYSKCLEEDSSSGNSLISEIYGYCFSIASMLCCDGESFEPGLGLYDELRHEKKLHEIAEFVMKAPPREGDEGQGVITRLFEKVTHTHSPHEARTSEVNRRMRFWTYAESMRQSPSVQYFLKDASGNPLPFPILYEIVKCMLRDKPDSYVKRDSVFLKSYFDCELESKVGEVAQKVAHIQAKCEFCSVPNPQQYAALTDHPTLELLVLLRLLQNSGHGPTSRESKPVQAPASSEEHFMSSSDSGDGVGDISTA
jgi:serine/threonine protein kinase